MQPIQRLPPADDPSNQSLCANCSAPVQGPWCGQCGQKRLTADDRRFGALLSQFVHELIHIDGKLPRTLGALVFKPGLASRAYLDGQRVRYLSPIGLFLLVNLLYFLAPPMTDFNLGLADQYHMQPYSGLVQAMVDTRLERRGIDQAEYAERYDQLNLNLARSLIILHLPLLALALMLLFPGSGRYYAEHFIVAIHLFTVLLLVALLALPMMYLLVRVGGEGQGHAIFRTVWTASPLLIVAHWLLTLRRCYQIGWIRAVLSVLALTVATVIIHFLFRIAQFLAVFAVS